eukprot:scaffold1891_cov178-Amphora_coffeaeformis.AAC.1
MASSLQTGNNEAATLIARGNYKEAFTLLRRVVEEQSAFLHTGNDAGDGDDLNGMVGLPWFVRQVATEAICSDGMYCWPLAIVGGDARDLEFLAALSATSLFNMALACHRSSLETVAIPPLQKHQMASQAQTLYLNAHILATSIDSPTLLLAISNNLIVLAFDNGNLKDVSSWQRHFESHAAKLSSADLSDTLLLHIMKVRLYYSMGFSTARAA